MKTTHTFKFLGRNWQLYRRGTGNREPGAKTPWSYRLTVDGKRVLISTRTAHLETAVLAAQARIAQVVKGRVEALDVDRAKRRGRLTVGDAIERYLEARLVRPRTAQNNVASLRRVLRVSTGQEDVDGLGLEVVTAGAASAYLAACQGRSKPDYGQVLKANAAANATLRMAKSVFATRHREIWADVEIPKCVAGFVGAKALKTGDTRYVPIPEDVLERIDAAAAELRESNPEVWLVNRLVRLCGLRNSEIEAAKTGWVIEHNGRLYLEIVSRPGEFVPKGHQGRVLVPTVLEPVLRERIKEAGGGSSLQLIEQLVDQGGDGHAVLLRHLGDPGVDLGLELDVQELASHGGQHLALAALWDAIPGLPALDRAVADAQHAAGLLDGDACGPPPLLELQSCDHSAGILIRRFRL